MERKNEKEISRNSSIAFKQNSSGKKNIKMRYLTDFPHKFPYTPIIKTLELSEMLLFSTYLLHREWHAERIGKCLESAVHGKKAQNI